MRNINLLACSPQLLPNSFHFFFYQNRPGDIHTQRFLPVEFNAVKIWVSVYLFTLYPLCQSSARHITCTRHTFLELSSVFLWVCHSVKGD